MTARERKTRLDRLGLGLKRNAKCSINGKVYPYSTHPTRSGGATLYFERAEDVDLHIVRVEEVRAWQEELMPFPEPYE